MGRKDQQQPCVSQAVSAATSCFQGTNTGSPHTHFSAPRSCAPPTSPKAFWVNSEQTAGDHTFRRGCSAGVHVGVTKCLTGCFMEQLVLCLLSRTFQVSSLYPGTQPGFFWSAANGPQPRLWAGIILPTRLSFVIGSAGAKDAGHHRTHLNACKMSNQGKVC